MMKKWHLIGIIKRIVNMKRWDSTVSPKRNILDFCSLNRTFYLSVEGTHVREISKIFWISAH